MQVGRLKEILAGYPDDMVVRINLEMGDDAPVVELRDILDRDSGKLERTVLQMRHWNYGQPVGHKHLTEEVRAKKRFEILDGLADARRPFKWANRRFTKVHGDYRIYRHSGGQNDTCYGTEYDPRLFAELIAEGLVVEHPTEMSPRRYRAATCEITDAGMAWLAEREKANATG